MEIPGVGSTFAAGDASSPTVVDRVKDLAAAMVPLESEDASDLTAAQWNQLGEAANALLLTGLSQADNRQGKPLSLDLQQGQYDAFKAFIPHSGMSGEELAGGLKKILNLAVNGNGTVAPLIPLSDLVKNQFAPAMKEPLNQWYTTSQEQQRFYQALVSTIQNYLS